MLNKQQEVGNKQQEVISEIALSLYPLGIWNKILIFQRTTQWNWEDGSTSKGTRHAGLVS